MPCERANSMGFVREDLLLYAFDIAWVFKSQEVLHLQSEQTEGIPG